MTQDTTNLRTNISENMEDGMDGIVPNSKQSSDGTDLPNDSLYEEFYGEEWSNSSTEEDTSGSNSDESTSGMWTVGNNGAQDEVQRLRDQLARLTADYQNLLRRVEQEKNEMASFFTEKFVKKMLPTVDNLDRVLTATPEELRIGSVYEGVRNAYAGLVKEFESMGVTSYTSLGGELDPNLHEALSQWPGPTGVIIAEFEKGYTLGKKVIRHAKVVVGNGNE